MRYIRSLLSLLLLRAAAAATPEVKNGNGFRDAVEDVVEDVFEGVHHAGTFLREEVHRTFLAGNILPNLEKLIITPEKFQKIFKTLGQVTDWQDFLFLITLSYATVPLFQLPYNSLMKDKKDFQDTGYHFVADHLQQISRIALLCYLVDMLKVVIIEMGFGWKHIPHIPSVFARSVYTLWVARRLALSKKWFLCKVWKKSPETLGRMELIDHLADAIILIVVALTIVDIFSVELGFAAKSIFAFGSIGTLVFSLASQGIVANLMNGILLSASDRVYEGDSVKFGDSIEGTVVKMGWVETVIRESDEVVTTVPNSDLASEKLSNLSRMTKCQVKQVLRFDYKDMAKLPQLCDDIKLEIRKACPQLIVDGTRPFRVHWVGYEKVSLNVVVDAHFQIRPLGDGYWDNQQRVLEAINRAVEKNDVKFV